MPVERVYVVLARAPGPADTDGRFVEIEREDGSSVHVHGEAMLRSDGRSLSAELWRIGPLWRHIADPLSDGHVSEGEMVQARIAANDLIALSDAHELEAHNGFPCLDNRIGLLAFVAHSLGLHPSRTVLSQLGDAMSTYGEHHHHEGHEH